MNFTKFQIKYLANMVIISLLTSAIVVTGMYYVVKTEIAYRIPDAAEQQMFSAMIFSELNKFLFFLIPVLVVLIAAVWFVIVRRMTGAESRLAQSLELLNEGNFADSIELDKSEFASLAAGIRKLRQKLNRDAWEERVLVDKIIEVGNEVLRESEKAALKKEKVINLVIKMKDLIESYEIKMNQYKIDKPSK